MSQQQHPTPEDMARAIWAAMSDHSVERSKAGKGRALYLDDFGAIDADEPPDAVVIDGEVDLVDVGRRVIGLLGLGKAP